MNFNHYLRDLSAHGDEEIEMGTPARAIIPVALLLMKSLHPGSLPHSRFVVSAAEEAMVGRAPAGTALIVRSKAGPIQRNSG
ncbi:MAG: hypothetical protein V1792_03500 [Pseudomonadota bacterium]